jgi:hypothetical protein
MIGFSRLLGRFGSSTGGRREDSRLRIGLNAAVAVFTALVLAACSGGASGEPNTGVGVPSQAAVVSSSGASGGSGAPVGTSAPSAAGSPLADEIPPGREIAEGGGGPASYTFREEWRRALAEAKKWRAGAYLVSGSGLYVNDDGVPSYWALNFIDRADADAVLKLEVDPWGKITRSREITGAGVASDVTEYTQRIPYAIIDSDKAVELGKAALAARYDLDKTKEPMLGLNFSVLDGSGPWWTYTLFHTSTAQYVSAQIDAMTGEATPL